MESFRFVSAASINAASIVVGNYLVRGYYVTNTNDTSSRFLHLFDRTTAPGNMTGVKWTVTIPSESGANPSWDNGLEFELGIAMALSTSPSALVAVAAKEIAGYIVYTQFAL